MRGILFGAGASVLDDPSESELRVFRGLRETRVEIVEAGREPGVVLAKAVHAQGDELVGKQLGQGRGDGFEVGASGDKLNVGVHGIAGGGKDAFAANGLKTRKAGGFDEFEPFFDAAR